VVAPGLSLEDVPLGVSQTRNERLDSLFYSLRLIEAYGTGVAKIVSSYRYSTRQPVLKATEGAFQVILPNRNIAGSHKSLGVAQQAESYPLQGTSWRWVRVRIRCIGRQRVKRKKALL